HQDPISWKSFDAKRFRRGLDEYVRRGRDPLPLMRMIFVLRYRLRDESGMEKAIRAIMAQTASEPSFEVARAAPCGCQSDETIVARLNMDIPLNLELMDQIRSQ
ncbi:MAG: hypothetical protein ACR2NZ_07135, partial [Rubripirellula sp.]